jgi:phosphatidylglycerol:prolipoprotein diacylglycerol transferase
MAGYLLFAYLWIKRNSAHYKGQIFVHYLIGFSAIRSIVELFRSNPKVLSFISVSFFLSVDKIAANLLLRHYLKKCYPLAADIQKRTPLTALLFTFLLITASISLYYFVQG